MSRKNIRHPKRREFLARVGAGATIGASRANWVNGTR